MLIRKSGIKTHKKPRKGLSSNKIMTYRDGNAKFSKFFEARRHFVQAVFTVFFKRVLKVCKMVVGRVAVNYSSNRIDSPELSFRLLTKLNETANAHVHEAVDRK